MAKIIFERVTKRVRQGHPKGYGAYGGKDCAYGSAKGKAIHVVGERFKEIKVRTVRRVIKVRPMANPPQPKSEKEKAYDTALMGIDKEWVAQREKEEAHKRNHTGIRLTQKAIRENIKYARADRNPIDILTQKCELIEKKYAEDRAEKKELMSMLPGVAL